MGEGEVRDAAGMLRVPARVELEGLDFSTNEAFLAAVAEVTSAEKALVKQA